MHVLDKYYFCTYTVNRILHHLFISTERRDNHFMGGLTLKQPLVLTFAPKVNLNLPVHLSSKCMCKDCGRKLEDMDRTQADKDIQTLHNHQGVSSQEPLSCEVTVLTAAPLSHPTSVNLPVTVSIAFKTVKCYLKFSTCLWLLSKEPKHGDYSRPFPMAKGLSI